jgi:hypothetical protein
MHLIQKRRPTTPAGFRDWRPAAATCSVGGFRSVWADSAETIRECLNFRSGALRCADDAFSNILRRRARRRRFPAFGVLPAKRIALVSRRVTLVQTRSVWARAHPCPVAWLVPEPKGLRGGGLPIGEEGLFGSQARGCVDAWPWAVELFRGTSTVSNIV